jgi:hypothetical protein
MKSQRREGTQSTQRNDLVNNATINAKAAKSFVSRALPESSK